MDISLSNMEEDSQVSDKEIMCKELREAIWESSLSLLKRLQTLEDIHEKELYTVGIRFVGLS